MNPSTSTPWQYLVKDMNADGQFTVSDLPLWLHQGFFLPGDCIIWMLSLHTPRLARFAELSPADYGGAVAAMVSALIWFFLIVVSGGTYGFVRNVDRAVTGRIIDLHQRVLLRGRIARVLLGNRLRKLRALIPPRAAETELPGELFLADEELRVLMACAELGPGFAMAASEVATLLGTNVRAARRTLGRLKSLELIDTGFGSMEEETVYTLSLAGRAFVAARVSPEQ
jgi:hypothetical protein